MMVGWREWNVEFLELSSEDLDEEEKAGLVVRPGPGVGVQGSVGPGEDIPCLVSHLSGEDAEVDGLELG
jgi:hypothetical protein